MFPYYVAYGLTIIASFLSMGGNRATLCQKNRNYCFAFAVIWIFLLGLRHPSMGIDLHYGEDFGYLGQFEVIGLMTWSEVLEYPVMNYEKGYMLFNKVLGLLGNNYQILLFACALVCISLISIWICFNSDYPALSVAIYLGLPCFLINYSGLRQALAISITTLSIEFIKRRRPVVFIALVLLACTFHYSAWLFLFAYPIYHLKMGKSVSIITVLLPGVVYVARYPLFNALSRLLKENAVPDDNGAFMLFLVFWLVYFFTVLFGHERDREELGLRNLFLMACLCQGMGGVYNTALRVGYYFMTSLVVLLPKIIVNNRNTFSWRWSSSSTLIMYLGIYICFVVFGLYMISGSTWAMTNPYTFFWQ